MKTCFFLLFTALFQFTDGLTLEPSPLTDMFIVNGKEAQIGEFPHQLLLEKSSRRWKPVCGAVLISETQALTAAHCVDFVSPRKLRVIAGLHEKSNRTNTQTTVLKKIVVHPTWKQENSTFKGDIALITFKTPIKFTEHIQAIKWNDKDKITFEHKKCTITGWGLDENAERSKTLLKTSMKVISNFKCQMKLFHVSKIHDGQICAQKANRGICKGDGGGPLTCECRGKVVLAGLASWGVTDEDGECNTKFPSVYSRVSFFKDFIQENLE